MPVSPELLSMLVCPVCKGDLADDPGAETLTCPRCRLRYQVEGEVPNMLVEKAEKF